MENSHLCLFFYYYTKYCFVYFILSRIIIQGSLRSWLWWEPWNMLILYYRAYYRVYLRPILIFLGWLVLDIVWRCRSLWGSNVDHVMFQYKIKLDPTMIAYEHLLLLVDIVSHLEGRIFVFSWDFNLDGFWQLKPHIGNFRACVFL